MEEITDPFQEARGKSPILLAQHQGETIPMILGWKQVRDAAKDWKTYSSDAPRRVPIPSEENVRTVRQYPLEVDPPVHADYRKLVEPFFHRPKLAPVQEKIHLLVTRLLAEAIQRRTVDVVRDFAIPLQSHALAYLLNVDETEAETWIGWGVHVFKEGDGESKGSFMERYCEQMFRRAMEQPGDDFFSALNQAEFQGRPLTMEEKLGFANIAFAGGRDTIIHTISSIFAYFARRPEALLWMRENPDGVTLAAEEFFRVYIPLTHIGRVCPQDTDVHGHKVEAGGRISLCWSAANRDPAVFENPNEVKLNRKPNPHLSFGSGIHNCLGAAHARELTKSLLRHLSEKVSRIEIIEAVECVEREADYTRQVGYDHLKVRLTGYPAVGEVWN